MDFFDFLAATPTSRKRPAGDQVAGLLALLVFPVLDFVTVSQLGQDTGYAMVVLLIPATFALATYVVGRRLKGRSGFCAAMAVLCVMTCYLASAAGVVSAAFLT